MTTIIESIQQTLNALHWTEIGAVIFAIAYLILAARENVWCWFWGILSCVLWAYSAYFLYELYVDALLQIFYIIISFLGLYQWLYGSAEKKALSITWLSLREHVIIITVGLVLTFIVGYFFDEYTQAAATYWDAFTTVFSVMITFMVIQKKIDNWLYWLVVDSVYVFLYWSRGGYLFALLFVAYLVIVVLGFLQWRRQLTGNMIE